MTFDANKLRVDLHNKFSSSDLTVNPDFQSEYINDIEQILTRLYASYSNADLPALLLSHVELLKAHQKLKSQFISVYCNSLGDERLNQQMYDAVHTAFMNIGGITPAIDNLVVPFIAKNRSAWVTRFKSILIQDNIEIIDEFKKLALFIALEFANKIVFKHEFDIYTKFSEQLTLQFQILIQYIDVETDIGGFKQSVLNCAPARYRIRPIIEYGFSNSEQHPENVLFQISNDFLMFTQHNINKEMTDYMLASLKPRLVLHQERLGILTQESHSLLIMGAVRETFQIYAKAHVALTSAAEQMGQHFFDAWLQNSGYSPLRDTLMRYKNQMLTRRASGQIHEALMTEVKQYLALPEFLQEKKASELAVSLTMG